MDSAMTEVPRLEVCSGRRDDKDEDVCVLVGAINPPSEDGDGVSGITDSWW